jgi:hypothetical protein
MLLYQQAKMEDALRVFTEILHPEEYVAVSQGASAHQTPRGGIDGVVELYRDACRQYIRAGVRRIRSDWQVRLCVRAREQNCASHVCL